MATEGAGAAGGSRDDPQLRNEEDPVEQLEKLSIQGSEQFDINQLIVAVKKIVAERDQLRKQLEEHKNKGDEVVHIKIKLLEEEVSILKNLVDIHSQCYQQAILLLENEREGHSIEDLQTINFQLLRVVMQKSDSLAKMKAEKLDSDVFLNLERENKYRVKKQVETLKSQLQATKLAWLGLEDKVQVLLQTSLANIKEQKKMIRALAEQECVGAESAANPNVLTQAQIREQVIACSQEDILLLKETLELVNSAICTSCQMQNKNAVLTTCCHMFCYDCLHARYKKKQRTCPKCNMAFGSSDYYRIDFDNM